MTDFNVKNTVYSSVLSSFAYKKNKSLVFSPCKRLIPKDLQLSSSECDIITENGEVFRLVSNELAYFISDTYYVVDTVNCIENDCLSYSRFFRIISENMIDLFVFMKDRNLSESSLIIQLSNNNTVNSFEKKFSFGFLEKAVISLLSRYIPFKEYFEIYGKISVSFPFGKVRESQKEMMVKISSAFRNKQNILLNAPTGIGKTIAALYPAAKSIENNIISGCFYLTSKNTVAESAENALNILNETGNCSYIRIVSKERICPFKDCNCRFCKYKENVSTDDYEVLKRKASSELLKDGNFSSKNIRLVSEMFSVCPHDVSVFLSSFCRFIICDYNYIFDIFSHNSFLTFSKKYKKYALLADEAHNLPSRVSGSYSCKLLLSEFMNLNDEYNGLFSDVIDKLSEYNKDLFSENEQFSDGKIYSYSKSSFLPSEFSSIMIETSEKIKSLLLNTDNNDLSDFYTKIKQFTSFDKLKIKGILFFAEKENDNISYSVICIDPSYIIGNICSGYSSSVFFSATLFPSEMYSDLMNVDTADYYSFDNNYDKDNLKVIIYDGISTLYSRRKDTCDLLSSVISSSVSVKKGKYLVFFPSYEYMRLIVNSILKKIPDINAVMQKNDMSTGSQKSFINKFRDKNIDNLIGFCVMGGVFSESIDLVGDDLIGVIIVGAGIPPMSSEKNLIKEYYDTKNDSGYLYSYIYPAINKIQQAAGRVIRNENDRGIVILIDDRLSGRDFSAEISSIWSNAVVTSSEKTLSLIIKKFWFST